MASKRMYCSTCEQYVLATLKRDYWRCPKCTNITNPYGEIRVAEIVGLLILGGFMALLLFVTYGGDKTEVQAPAPPLSVELFEE